MEFFCRFFDTNGEGLNLTIQRFTKIREIPDAAVFSHTQEFELTEINSGVFLSLMGSPRHFL